MRSELHMFSVAKCDPMPNQDDIFGTAERLLMSYGFAEARTAADEMIGAWRRSNAHDAKEGLRMWRDIRTAIDVMESQVEAA